MMKRAIPLTISAIAFAVLVSCTGNKSNNAGETSTSTTRQPVVKGTEITYYDGSTPLKGYIAYDESLTGKRPGILVIHEWWGNNDYSRMRANMLAELGYVAMAVDMYGNGLLLDNPQDAQNTANQFYTNPALMKQRMMVAYNTLIADSLVNAERIAAIGYCFGGAVVLNSASMGVPLDAVVSIHGGLTGFKATPEMKNVNVLICHGGADPFVPQADIDNFKSEMQNMGVNYEFKVYEGATHAFSNKASTEAGKKFNMPISYNAAADSASWSDMVTFFQKYFPSNN